MQAWTRPLVNLGNALPVINTTECKSCGLQWAVEPALSVACSVCDATEGEACTFDAPSGVTIHIAREAYAMTVGKMAPCTALSWSGRHNRRRLPRCEAVDANQNTAPPADIRVAA